MRRIKLVVMAVGVSFSVAPIFNSAFAQQRNNEASLLLDVQSMRQEIEQLRDMVERQQFEMRKLKRQQQEIQTSLSAKQTVPAEAVSVIGAPQFNQSLNNDGSGNIGANSSYPNLAADQVASATLNSAVVEVQEPLPDFQKTDVVSVNNATLDDSTLAPAVNDGSIDASQVPTNGTVIEQRIITAAPPNANNSAQQSDGVPVIDRSFSQAVREVPVTGNGAVLNRSNPTALSNSRDLTAQAINTTDGVASAKNASPELTNRSNVAQTAPNAVSGGVISIPQNSETAWVTNTAAATKTVTTSTPVVNSAITSSPAVVAAQRVLASTDTAADNAPVLSEDDYYGQGFELLKQSKYEEASIIFKRQIKFYPNGNLADDAHYWIAEAMHVSRKLDVSKQHLKIIINDYPQSPRLPDAMLKTAYIEQSQGNKMEAQLLFQEIVNLHPKSDAAIAAKNQLAASN